MYIPAHFAAEEADALIQRLARRAAGVLVTVDAEGQLIATHLPILWDSARKRAIGHIARANPHHTLSPSGRALIVLAGPEAYVSPSLYPSKREHGKTVPTWNYEAVHLSGTLEWFSDVARLEAIVRDLSALHEEDRAEPWKIEDAPRSYIDALLRGIVGVEFCVEKIEAKRKLSQNKSAADFDGVMQGLAASDRARAQEVAVLMRGVCALSDKPDGN
jgi:transcriptional regulator